MKIFNSVIQQSGNESNSWKLYMNQLLKRPEEIVLLLRDNSQKSNM